MEHGLNLECRDSLKTYTMKRLNVFLNVSDIKRQCSIYSALLCMLVSLCSCHQPEKNMTQCRVVDSIDSFSISNYMIRPQKDSIYLCQTYPFSQSLTGEKGNEIVVYDDREHALIYFRDSVLLRHIQLSQHGVNAVSARVQSFLPVNDDSIWVYDQVAFYLINGSGEVIAKHKDEEYVFAGSNYAMHTAHMGWQDNGILLYPTTDGKSFKIKMYDYRKSEIVNEIKFTYPSCNPNGNKKYPYMDCPNVTFARNKVIYNFPYEKNIHVIDLLTEDIREYSIQSVFAKESLKPYGEDGNSADWMRYNWSNNHFYEVSYLPALDIYVRPMLGGSDMKRYGNSGSVVDARKLYLSFFDSQFNTIGEMELQEHRYSNFHGWCSLSDGMAVYVDNLLGGNHEELVYDVIKPVL